MRIALLQFSAQLGEPERNAAQADSLLASADIQPGSIDLLVLPELALTGYNFSDRAHISPFLEATAGGPSAQWAARTAARLRCLVTIGYPEVTADASLIPDRVADSLPLAKDGTAFNAALTVRPDGCVAAHHRKAHLYYTDATWAEPAPGGFGDAVDLPLHLNRSREQVPTAQSDGTGDEVPGEQSAPDDMPCTRTTFAICMDLNPRFFSAPSAAYEAAQHAVDSRAEMLVACMAWLTRAEAHEIEDSKTEPDVEVLGYWIERFSPLLDGDRETVVAIANRTGEEPGECRACELDPARRVGKRGETDMAREEVDKVGEETDKTADAIDRPGAEPVVSVDGESSHTGGQDENGIGGWEPGQGPVVSSEARYAGTSCVMVLGRGRAKVLGVMGKATEGVLVVDTDDEPVAIYRLSKREL